MNCGFGMCSSWPWGSEMGKGYNCYTFRNYIFRPIYSILSRFIQQYVHQQGEIYYDHITL